jgi:hypothetical protein
MTSATFKATVQIDDKTITIEGPREFVEEQLSRLVQPQSSKHNIHCDSSAATHEATVHNISERQLIDQKRPKGHLETVVVLAFALASTGTTEFTEEDIHKAYLRARVRPPKVVAQALRDAKNRMDYIESGKKRGTYRLSRHGDRTVRFDLPRT